MSKLCFAHSNKHGGECAILIKKTLGGNTSVKCSGLGYYKVGVDDNKKCEFYKTKLQFKQDREKYEYKDRCLNHPDKCGRVIRKGEKCLN